MQTLDRETLERVSSSEPDWMRERRVRGYELFSQLPMPDPKEEAWRYVELSFDLSDFGLPDAPGSAMAGDGGLRPSLGEIAGHALVIDGFVTECSSDAGNGVTFSSLRQAFHEAEEQVQAAIDQGVAPGLDKFSAAHQAFQRDGVFLHVGAGRAVPDPFYIEVQAATPGVVSMPRIIVAIGSDAEASVVIAFRSPQDRDLLVIPQIEGSIDAAGRLRLTTFQDWGYHTNAMAHQRLVVDRDASINFGEVGLGAGHSRLHLAIDLLGSGSSAEVSGAYFGDRTQVLDYRYFMTHAAPHTNSNMFLKGAVEDEAKSVFTGLIRIEEVAQRTDAFQTNRNLVLSEGALANSVPNLEILANDVKCGHGSSMGPLDQEQRYYLQSRGLDRIRADRLQVRGFFEEAIRKFPTDRLAHLVRERVNAKFVEAQEEGRV